MTTTPQAALLSDAAKLADELDHEASKRACNVAMMPASLPVDAAKELRRLDALVAHLTADRDDTANELALRTKHNLALTNERDLLAKLQATQELVQAGSASLLDGCKSIMDSIAVSSSVIEHNKQEPVQAGELPPLPDPAHRGQKVTGDYFNIFTAEQMHAYARAALSARKPLTDGQSKPLPPNIGDYVLATKYSDGDPGDAWALGFYAGNVEDRHLVNDAAGLAIRLGGYRRVGRIPTEIGNWLWANRDNLERAPLKISLWGMYDWAYVNEMLAPGSCGIGLEVKP